MPSGIIARWRDWADTVLARQRPAVLVHGDLHGDNQVWCHDQVRLVVDFGTADAAEPEYDLRTFPGTGPGVAPVPRPAQAAGADPAALGCGQHRHIVQQRIARLAMTMAKPTICPSPMAARACPSRTACA